MEQVREASSCLIQGNVQKIKLARALKQSRPTIYLSCTIILIFMALISPSHSLSSKSPSSHTPSHSPSSPSAKVSHQADHAKIAAYRNMTAAELKRSLQTMEADIKNMLKQRKKDQERRLLKVIARDLIRSAYKERDLKMRQKLLKFGVELNEHPGKTVARLKKETSTKDEAKRLLEGARNQTDPNIQEDLMNEAEKKIYWLETGKLIKDRSKLKKAQLSHAKRINKAKTQNKKLNNSADTIKTEANKHIKKLNFKAEYNETEVAKSLALELVEKSKIENDQNKKHNMMRYAYGMLHTPHRSLREYRDVEWKKRIIRMKSDLLMRHVNTVPSEEKKIELIEKLNIFYKNPLEEVKVIEDAEKKALYVEGKTMAIDLLKQAEIDLNPASQEVKIRTAKILVQFPISTLKNIQNQRTIDLYLEKVPQPCKPVITKVMENKLHGLEHIDFNRIVEKVESRIKLFSEGKPYGDSGDQTNSYKIEEPGYPAEIGLINDNQIDSLLANVFAETLEKTYHKVAKHNA